jgi:hypothetical protein
MTWLIRNTMGIWARFLCHTPFFLSSPSPTGTFREQVGSTPHIGFLFKKINEKTLLTG